MTRYRVTVERDFEFEAETAREAVLRVVDRPMTIDISDVVGVDEIIPQPPLTHRITRDVWAKNP